MRKPYFIHGRFFMVLEKPQSPLFYTSNVFVRMIDALIFI